MNHYFQKLSEILQYELRNQNLRNIMSAVYTRTGGLVFRPVDLETIRRKSTEAKPINIKSPIASKMESDSKTSIKNIDDD